MNRLFITMYALTLIATSAFSQDATSTIDRAAVPDANTKTATSDRYTLHSIFDDSYIAENALTIHRRAARMPAQQRYQYLADWVLPNANHNTIRTTLAFTPTHPAPPVQGNGSEEMERLLVAQQSGQSRVQIGGQLVAPALDLVEIAKELRRLDGVRDRVDQFTSTDSLQQRSQLAMLVVIDAKQGDFEAAQRSMERLFALVQAGEHTSFAERCPETIAIASALQYPELRDLSRDMLFQIVGRQLRHNVYSGVPAWEKHIQSMWGQVNAPIQKTRHSLGMPPGLDQWSGANRVISNTRGGGYPRAHWLVSADRVENLSIHCDDYLFFQSPLRGNFEVECDITPFAWRDTTIYVAGKWVAPVYNLTSYRIGNVRGEKPRRPLPRKLGKPRDWFRYRAVVRDNVFTTYINGRKIHDEALPAEHEPWLAIRSVLRNAGVTRGLRITGDPVIPETVRLSVLHELPGWMPYFGESVGGPNSDWRQEGEATSGGEIVGRRRAEFAGTGKESLLYYVRPMFENGEIEYEFYYHEGQSSVHPTLDRMTFMIESGGVQLHWIADGKYDRTGLDPMNLAVELENRRGQGDFPLKNDAWNRLKLSLVGDTVHLFLNGKEVYQRKVATTNQRTFGLFHYSGQTEARVRNLVWKGDWPLRLPPVKDQELAGEGTDFIDAGLSKLTATYEHDFAKDGLPTDRFNILGGEWPSFVVARPDGVHVTRPGASGRYLSYSIVPRCVVKGDFDITAIFSSFEPAPSAETNETKCSLILSAALSDPAQTRADLYRRHVRKRGREDDPLVQGLLLQSVDDQERRRYFGSVTFEADSGTLRLARRGKKMYYLVAEGDSSYFRLIGDETIADDDLQPNGVQIQSQVFGPGSSTVIWRKIVIRANEIVDSAAEARTHAITELQRQLTGELPANALEFNGRTHYVTVPSIMYDGSHPITLEAFVTHDRLRSVVVGDTQQAGFAIGVPSKQYNMHAWNGTNYNAAVSAALAPINVRVHLAGTFDGQTLAVFVNGILLKTSPLRGTFVPSGFPLTIGASPSPTEAGLDYAFAGLIDGVRVSKTVRYKEDFEPPTRLTADADTLAVYQFNEGDGQTLGDSSGNGHDGEIRGAKWVNDVAIRRRAAAGLAALGQDGVEVLIGALQHQNPDVQIEATKAIGMIWQDAKTALPALRQLSEDNDPRVSEAARQAVASIERSPLLESLLNLFN